MSISAVQTPRAAGQLLCPSAPGLLPDSVLIGVVTAQPEGLRILPTATAMPVTPEILKLAEPVNPSEVFRFASACHGCSCTHFKNDACQLAVRSVDLLDEVTAGLPRCPIRSQCRWFHQEGAAICRRCPQILTDQYVPHDRMLEIVYGTDPSPLSL